MKYFNIIFSVLFVICAGLQYNDPDPYLWVPIYLFAAFLCMQASRNIYYPRAHIAGIIVYLIYGVFLLFDKYGVIAWATTYNAENLALTMKASKPWIEETREFFGLIILIIVLAINYITYRKHLQKAKT